MDGRKLKDNKAILKAERQALAVRPLLNPCPQSLCLLEKGMDLRYIQDILGHESTKTTETYTHITKKAGIR